MTLGPVMMDLVGTELSAVERDMLRHPLVGGVILFSRNYESPEQLEKLIFDIHAVRQPRLLVAVDHEGGRVQRFRDGFTRLPPVAGLSAIHDSDRKRAKRLAELSGWLMATELRAVDVDFSFAPVLDLDHGLSAVIGDRAFHRQPDVVADLAHSYMLGMNRAGMAAVGKHFPGHGATAADTHTHIAEDTREFADILIEDLIPFERMIHFGIPAIMAAHVVYPRVDPNPAGFSAFWLRDVLRGRLEFGGAIFSDDLSMAGANVVGDVRDRAQSALQAGCDMVPVCNDPDGVAKVLDALRNFDDPAAHMRLVRMHGREPITRAELHRDEGWQQAVHAILSYAESPELELDV